LIHPAKNLQKINEFANKKLGQNFLTSNAALNFLEEIITNKDNVLEIGPGFGAVTEILQNLTKNLVLIDTDHNMIDFMVNDFGFAKDKIIHRDFLKVEKSQLEKFSINTICGNLPFNISTPIIEKVILEYPAVDTIIVGLQLEYAKRCTMKKGNSWSIFLQAAGSVSFIKKISKKAFFPEPGVDSAWIVWRRDAKVENLSHLTTFLRCSFWAKRKNLYNNLRKNPYIDNFADREKWLELCETLKNDLQKNRADALTIDEILKFYKLFLPFLK